MAITTSASATFASLGLAEPVLRALAGENYTIPTPIQAQAIPHVMSGKDVLGCAQTGTGKTAAFALPVLHRLANTKLDGQRRAINTLVLAPTRELVHQIAESFAVYGKHLEQDLHLATVYGGVGQGPQVRALRAGLDVLVATPGRLEDLMEQGFVDLRSIKTLILDEADRMLDMGFIHAIRRVVAKMPKDRQTLLFSATMPDEIRRLCATVLRNPVSVQVAPVASTADQIEQSVYMIEKRNKPALLAHLFHNAPISRGLVFVRTKHGADRVVRHLHSVGIRAEAIHGNKSQNARQRALENFRSGRTPLLIASDVASRGIDVDNISHVINFDLTHEPETYVHRIGRTGRAGATGVAISFCDGEERSNLRAIEKLIRKAIPVRTDHPSYSAMAAAAPHASAGPSQQAPSHHQSSPQPQARRGGPSGRAPGAARHAGPAPRHAAARPAHAAHPQHKAAQPARQSVGYPLSRPAGAGAGRGRRSH
jgi:ATP-dependent RNA helicase RhlE